MKFLKKIIVTFTFFNSIVANNSKILIFTFSHNRPDFIEIQYKTFKKFLKDDYEFIVFNDATNNEMQKNIEQTCEKLNLKCIRIPQEIHSQPYLQRWPGENYNHPSIRCCNVVQYSLDNFGFNHDGIVCLFDSDMFLVREFSISKFLKNYDIMGVPQSNSNHKASVTHISVHLAFLNMKNLPDKRKLNFNCGKIYEMPIDAGGHTYYYLKDHPQLKIYYTSACHSFVLMCQNCQKSNQNVCLHNTKTLIDLGFNQKEIKFIHSGANNVEFLLNKNFLHYRGGTNWDHKTNFYHQNKTKMLNDFISDILN